MGNLALAVDDLLDEINYALIHRIPTTHYVVMGDLANIIIEYLKEMDIPQFTEDEEDYIEDCESNVVYTISVATYEEEPLYFIQEAYYQTEEGEILAAFEGDICYIDSKAELTDEDLDRIDSNLTVTFDIETE